MELYKTDEDIVMQLSDRVGEAQRVATQSLKEMELKKVRIFHRSSTGPCKASSV